MEEFTNSLIAFLAILNPFALCLYLEGLMEDMTWGDFLRTMGSAALVSLATFTVFAVAGEAFLTQILNVRPEALRIFGGVIFFGIGYNYVTRGYRATETLRGSLDELSSVIALPLMIGAGTITQSILIGKHHTHMTAFWILLAGVAASIVVVIVFRMVRHHIRKRNEAVFYKYVNVLSRLNGLLIGAISTEMVITGVKAIWKT